MQLVEQPGQANVIARRVLDSLLVDHRTGSWPSQTCSKPICIAIRTAKQDDYTYGRHRTLQWRCISSIDRVRAGGEGDAGTV
jgi:hypothetical protein